MPQTGWLKTMEIYYLIVQATGSPKSGCWQGCATSAGSREGPFLRQVLLFPGVPGAAQLQPLLPSSHGCLLPGVHVCMPKLSSSSKDCSYIGFWVHANQV